LIKGRTALVYKFGPAPSLTREAAEASPEDGKETRLLPTPMPTLETAIREANRLPVHNLPDAETVARLSEIIRSSAVLGALRRSDAFFAFVLRAVRRVLADHSLTDRQVITSLWSIFDDPDLNGALDIPQKSPMAIVPRKPKQAR
jgi:hypothetical protein